jgi:uncharacterized iron-regulated membrane protein
MPDFPGRRSMNVELLSTGRDRMQRLSKILNLVYATSSLLLGWLGAIVGLALLAAGIVGAIVGQIIWWGACTMIAAAAGKLERPQPRQKGAAPEGYAQSASLD